MRPISVPPGVPKCENFTLLVNGQPIDLLSVGIASIGRLEMEGPISVEVRAKAPLLRGEIRPRRLNIPITISDGVARFTLKDSGNFWIDLAGEHAMVPLYLFAFAPEENPPLPSDPDVVYFAGGKVHEAGVIHLREGQTLYLAADAVVRGVVHAAEAHGVRICGRGVLDATPPADAPAEERQRRMIVLEGCRGASISDVTLIHPRSWMVMLFGSRDVSIRNLHEVGQVISSDGVDIVGSQRVLIEGCFLRNNDDCIAVKAFDFRGGHPDIKTDGGQDVRDVLVRDCTFWNDGGGNAMEIGFETRTAQISNIVFRNIDVLAAHDGGAVFSIHLGDRAAVRDVLWEDIRVEHFYSLLVDFRIFDSRWSKDTQRGTIRGVTLRRITTIPDVFNTPSLIGGFDSQHTTEDIRFEQFTVGDRHIRSAEDLHLFTNQHSHGITFV